MTLSFSPLFPGQQFPLIAQEFPSTLLFDGLFLLLRQRLPFGCGLHQKLLKYNLLNTKTPEIQLIKYKNF